MATTPQTVPAAPDAPQDLQAMAKRHLWMHFTRMGAYESADVPVIARGEGCYVWDTQGNRYLDGLSALFCVNVGHGRAEIGEAMAAQAARARLLHELELRAPARDRAGCACRVVRAGRPEPRLLHVGRVGGRRVRAQARRATTTASAARASGTRSSRARSPTTARRSARSPRPGIPGLRTPFEPLTPGGCHVPNTNEYHWPEGARPAVGGRQDRGADRVRGPRDRRRGDPRAGAERRRLLHAAGGLLPARARDLRPPRRAADLRRGHLLMGPARPLVRLRALRLPAGHRHDRQGPDVGVRADGRGDRLGRDRRAVPGRQDDVRPRVHVRRAPGRGGRGAREPRHLRARGHQRARARRRSPSSARCSRACATCRSSATCAAPGSSRRSSSSRTRRRARPSTTTSPSGCCAASSPASSTSRA